MIEIDEDGDYEDYSQFEESIENPFTEEYIPINATSKDLMEMSGMLDAHIIYVLCNKPLFEIVSRYTGGLIHAY